MTTSITSNKTSYTFDLEITQNITDIDSMGMYTVAVINFIEGNMLPGFSYPEVYEFFVVQRNCPLEDNHIFFDMNSVVSENERVAFCRFIQEMTKKKILHNQLKLKKRQTLDEQIENRIEELESEISNLRNGLSYPIENTLKCDYCREQKIYINDINSEECEILHFSGHIKGEYSHHIHLCKDCIETLGIDLININ